MSNAAAARAWRESFEPTTLEVVGKHSRKLQFSLDTHKYRRFSAALVEAKSERRVYLDPDWVDNGRYRLQCILNLEPGYLACLLNCRTVFEHDTYPRPVKFKITLLYGTEKVTTTVEHTFSWDRDSFGNSKMCSLLAINSDAAFRSSGNLHIEVNIEEECQSRDKPFLRQPPSLSLIKQRLGWSFLHRPNVRVILADGELYVHELPLSLLCEHFKQLFSSQFIEGSVEAPGESLGCAPEVAQRVADEEAEDKSVEPTAEYDSDYEEPQDRQSVPQIKHQRTLRIPFFSTLTFQAFIIYLYFDMVTFRPLRSSEASASPRSPQACSPKSLWECADYFDVPGLKRTCEVHFMRNITPKNVLQELSHRFARVFPEIAKKLKVYAVAHWAEVEASPDFATALEEVLAYEESRAIYQEILEETKQK